MISPEICKEQILSEDYRDFVVNNSRALPIPGLAEETLCLQNAGFGYQCYYISSRRVQSITAERFSYTAIPKCYTPLSMDSLNQAGISPLHNYPGLQLRGEGILIGFLDSGIDYQTPIFRTAPPESPPSGIKPFRAEPLRKTSPMAVNIPQKPSMLR